MITIKHLLPHARLLSALAMAFALSACAWMVPREDRAQALLGASEAEVRAAQGSPAEIYRLKDGHTRWLYPTQPFGQFTYAAEFDANGKLISFRQVLRTLEFARAEIGKWTRQDILEQFGKPLETSYFPRMQRETWSYRFKHEDVWPSLYHFYFDPSGVLRLTQVSPDPMYEPRERPSR